MPVQRAYGRHVVSKVTPAVSADTESGSVAVAVSVAIAVCVAEPVAIAVAVSVATAVAIAVAVGVPVLARWSGMLMIWVSEAVARLVARGSGTGARLGGGT